MERPRSAGLGGIVALLLLGALAPAAAAAPRAELPRVVLHEVPFTLKVSDPDLAPGDTLDLRVTAGADVREVRVPAGEAVEVKELALARGEDLRLSWNGGEAHPPVHSLPGWTSLLPPLVAILLAVLFRQVVLALLAGVWLGAVLVFQVDPFTGLLRAMDTYVSGSLQDSGHVTILLFSFLLGGMLGVIQRAGGTKGIVNSVAPLARSPRSAQVTAWILGILVFFDDYANTLLVGPTMRPITDRLKVSREKLAYIVDSTAAPVASIAVISTWIGVEVGLIHDAFVHSGIQRDAFGAFVASLPYRFYPIFALVFGLLVATTGRDFGPMLRAERRARRKGLVLREGAMPLADFGGEALEPPADKPHRWLNAAVPILVVVVSVLIFIYVGGRKAAIAEGKSLDLKTIVGSADSYSALLWAAFLGSASALLLSVGQRILSIHAAMEAWLQGAKSLFLAAVILTLAWSIGMITSQMGTAGYLVHVLSESLKPHWVPVLVFILSGLTSFATGSSWSTMAILMPLVIPLAHRLAPGSDLILAGTISSVLAGSVWGDHCSPISDTTVLSSMASSSDHVDHVNTQLPYAIVVALVGMAVGDIPTAFGMPFWVSWVVGAAALAGILYVFGRKDRSAPGETVE
jgi:Na+/H+ antiporter NhaC